MHEQTSTAAEEIVSSARVVHDQAPDRFTVLIANAKGGCGKTTLATNLASGYAARHWPVSLLDMDPQQSADLWLQQRRRAGIDNIHGLTFPLESHTPVTQMRARVRDARDVLVIDSPAGLHGQALDQALQLSQVVLIPVLPSPIDIRAATRFLQTILLSPSYQRRPRRLAVIANRSRQRTRMYAQLNLFLNSLKIPFLTTLRDTQLYVQAVDQGKGIQELEDRRAEEDQRHWQTVMEWLEIQRQLIRSLPGFLHPR
ncbi:MAG: AAA family ATPase [Alcanivoracaceae bacterium]